MPIDIEQSRQQIENFRLSRKRTENQLALNQNRIKQLEKEHQILILNGAKTTETTSVFTEIEAQKVKRKSLLNGVTDIDLRINDIINDVFTQVTPEKAFEQLDGSIPVAMFPARLETRFVGSGNKRHLMVRIYPDQIHLDAHTPALLPKELEAGKKYWQIRHSNDNEKTESAWIKLCSEFSPGRAIWIVRSLVPKNLGGDDVDLNFPEPVVRLDSSGDVPKAKLLPDRWVVIGYKRGRNKHTEIFRKWGTTVPDSLNVTISFDEQADEVTDENSLPIDQGMLWSVDYKEAERMGMAITLSDEDVTGSRTLQAGADLLLVLGVDWTHTPEQTANNVSKQFEAHQYSDGMAFIRQGTPTNNTDAVRSGFNSNPLALSKNTDPIVKAVSVNKDNAASRLITGLGLTDEAESIASLQNAGIQEQAINSLMIDALWESTMGHYLDEFIDPLASDNAIDLARDHASNYLQPFGPFSAMRIGKQPYGMIPVMAPGLFKADRINSIESVLSGVLKVLHWYWREGVNKVSYMGKSNNPDDDLLALLQHVPVSTAKHFRRVIDTELAANVDGIKSHSKIQVDIMLNLVLKQFKSGVDFSLQNSKIAQMATFPTSYPHYAPWVQSGELEAGIPLSPNYIISLQTLLQQGAKGRSKIRKQTSSRILLEALLAHAALRELDHSGIKLIDKFLVNIGVFKEQPFKSQFQVQSLMEIYKEESTTSKSQFFIQTPEQVAQLVIPSIVGNRNTKIADYLAQQLFHSTKETPELHNLNTFSQSLNKLSQFPAKEIDRSFRAVLDCYSYRLDAWYTSLASRRLNTLRKRKPKGLHIGAYAWVENLRPATGNDSLGYIHTPSIAHASTAAILRSGHLSHRGSANNNKSVTPGSSASALNIDLSSDRVRIALSTMEAVAQGEALAAILGYRFERMLQERDQRLAKYILRIRKLSPYKETSPDSTSDVSEDIAAREVVDGVKILELWRQNSSSLLLKIQPDTTTHRKQINETFEKLDDMLDAISDTLVSESVYQTVRGNYERAGAAIAALDRQTRPPDPEFVRTPRTQHAYQQRVLLLLQKTALTDEWTGVFTDIRASTPTPLNAWVAEMIGDPQRYEIVAHVIEDDAVVEVHTVSLLQFLKAMQISPLSAVLMSVSTNKQTPSELELACARYFANQVSNPKQGMGLELVALSDNAMFAEKLGFSALQSLLEIINKALVKPRVADARDLTPMQGELTPNIDIEELQVRFDRAINVLIRIIETLTLAIEQPGSHPAVLSNALIEAFRFGATDAQPDVIDTDPDAETLLAKQAISVRDQLKIKHQNILQVEQNFESSDETGNDKTAQYLIKQITCIFGESFPVLPLFEPHNQVELLASFAEQDQLKQGNDFACLTWLQQIAYVRPQLEKQVSVLTGSELLGNTHINDHLHVMQLPHKTGQAWAGLTLPSEPEDLLLALVTIGEYALNQPLAGLVVDGWNEAIPVSKETTGISFHYDAPASRAPQSVILAVPPSLQQKTWTFDALVQTLLHTHELSKMRAVGPKELPVLGGGMLPMIYFASDKSKHRPSIDLDLISNFWKSKVKRIRGKMNSHAFRK